MILIQVRDSTGSKTPDNLPYQYAIPNPLFRKNAIECYSWNEVQNTSKKTEKKYLLFEFFFSNMRGTLKQPPGKSRRF